MPDFVLNIGRRLIGNGIVRAWLLAQLRHAAAVAAAFLASKALSLLMAHGLSASAANHDVGYLYQGVIGLLTFVGVSSLDLFDVKQVDRQNKVAAVTGVVAPAPAMFVPPKTQAEIDQAKADAIARVMKAAPKPTTLDDTMRDGL